MKLGEFEIISRIFAPLSTGFPGAKNLQDDAAYFSSNEHTEFVVTCDTLVAGVHFFPCDAPDSIARKALGVNLSDMAAKGAEPFVYMLSLSMSETADGVWLEQFADGLKQAQSRTACHLVGGDTVSTNGPLTITITMIGRLPKGVALLRSGARVGDIVFVSGTIGDSFLGLRLRTDREKLQDVSETAKAFLSDRYLHPQPRNNLAQILRTYATASIDISDGLGADFAKLCLASSVGGVLLGEKIPLSEAARDLVKGGKFKLDDLIAGGDDYEVLFTVSAEKERKLLAAVSEVGGVITQIGQIADVSIGVHVLYSDGRKSSLNETGYDHFK